MALATYQDLCIDVSDARVEGEFWATMLGLRLVMHDDGDAHLDGAERADRIWLNRVPEPQTVKNRIHLDVNAESVDRALDAGARVLYEMERWTTLADPEGQEFCVFVRPEPIATRFYELGWDTAEGAEHDLAGWWAEVVGGVVVDHERGYSWIEQIPGCPWDSIDFAPVPEPKTVKNRVHLDVTTDDLDAVVAHGATVLRPKGDEGLRWTVLADPGGNEFCAFTAD
jgi:predicted enzyme related to lactoylglutathione lyase